MSTGSKGGRRSVGAPLGNRNAATLTRQQEDEIRMLHATSKHRQRELAERFGVHQATISRILSKGKNTCTLQS